VFVLLGPHVLVALVWMDAHVYFGALMGLVFVAFLCPREITAQHKLRAWLKDRQTDRQTGRQTDGQAGVMCVAKAVVCWYST